ncbi:hypothetical protein WN943_016293 [Citrus x changshan-huyou]
MLSFKEFWTKKTLLGLGLGQFLSLLITSTGFSSSELARKGINAPTSQSFFNYVLLAIVYGSLMLYRRQPLKILVLSSMENLRKSYAVNVGVIWIVKDRELITVRKAKWYYYLILGLIDVEGNFLAGLVTVIFSDVHAGDRGSGSNPRKGDALVIAGATLYAVSNVSEEFLVKKADRIELMAFLGLFGGIISAVQISILERKELQSIHWSVGAALPFFGYALAMFLFYSFVPILLKTNGATMLNLSLLTSDMWAVLIRIGAYHEKVDWLYFIAFAAVAVGLIIYSGGDKDDDQPCAEIVDEEALGNKDFEDEASCSQRTAGGSSKTRDASKHKSAASGIGENLLLENKNEGYDDALGKKS